MKSAEIISDMLALIRKIRQFEKQTNQILEPIKKVNNVHYIEFKQRTA